MQDTLILKQYMSTIRQESAYHLWYTRQYLKISAFDDKSIVALGSSSKIISSLRKFSALNMLYRQSALVLSL